ncbi:Methyltransferase family protein [Prunus dulcis]|uniref:Methyltransferase family protein n=1 Tax=Prunus dulcis TaxID=3755 RepID=A0A4Y1RQU9_PRUDU|nr:Methyltransferase family protein [Prunus dulcis]
MNLCDSTQERRYLLEEFPELVNCKENSKVLEVDVVMAALFFLYYVNLLFLSGIAVLDHAVCFLPVILTRYYFLRSGNENIIVYACDCSNEALERVKETIFTVSALPLHRMPESIKECFSVLKPGGLLFFRDYGLYDMSMLRFEMDKRVGFREYMRSDGTRSYFFCLDTVRNLFVGAGFTELELEYCCVKSVNRRNGKSMRRVWVHGKFQKPN